MNKRDLSLSPRIESTRDKQTTIVVNFSLMEIKEHFEVNISAINNQFDVASNLQNVGRESDQKNIYRSQIVFLESAFDYYLHELNKYGLRQILAGNWAKTPKYNNLRIPMKQVEIGLQEPSAQEWFVEFINEAYSRDVMTSHEYLKDQLNMLGINLAEVLSEVFPEEEKPQQFIIDLYDRRNRIAHQTDRDHADATQTDITEEYVKDCIAKVVKIVFALHNRANDKG